MLAPALAPTLAPALTPTTRTSTYLDALLHRMCAFKRTRPHLGDPAGPSSNHSQLEAPPARRLRSLPTAHTPNVCTCSEKVVAAFKQSVREEDHESTAFQLSSASRGGCWEGSNALDACRGTIGQRGRCCFNFDHLLQPNPGRPARPSGAKAGQLD
eukprot:362475-Chlamydomonas_euryale.AAC.2